MAKVKCPYCGGASVAQQWLCAKCLEDIMTKWDTSQSIVIAYTDACMREMEPFLASHLLFTDYCLDHGLDFYAPMY